MRPSPSGGSLFTDMVPSRWPTDGRWAVPAPCPSHRRPAGPMEVGHLLGLGNPFPESQPAWRCFGETHPNSETHVVRSTTSTMAPPFITSKQHRPTSQRPDHEGTVYLSPSRVWMAAAVGHGMHGQALEFRGLALLRHRNAGHIHDHMWTQQQSKALPCHSLTSTIQPGQGVSVRRPVRSRLGRRRLHRRVILGWGWGGVGRRGCGVGRWDVGRWGPILHHKRKPVGNPQDD